MSKLERIFEEDSMITPISGLQFRETGALWLINTILHTMGMAITWNPETDELKAAIVKFRGFDLKCNDDGYRKVTEYMKDNAEILLKDCDE